MNTTDSVNVKGWIRAGTNAEFQYTSVRSVYNFLALWVGFSGEVIQKQRENFVNIEGHNLYMTSTMFVSPF